MRREGATAARAPLAPEEVEIAGRLWGTFTGAGGGFHFCRAEEEMKLTNVT